MSPRMSWMSWSVGLSVGYLTTSGSRYRAAPPSWHMRAPTAVGGTQHLGYATDSPMKAFQSDDDEEDEEGTAGLLRTNEFLVNISDYIRI